MHILPQVSRAPTSKTRWYATFCCVGIAVVLCSTVVHLGSAFSAQAATSLGGSRRPITLRYPKTSPVWVHWQDSAHSFSPSAYTFASSPNDLTTIFIAVSAFVDTRLLTFNATPELVIIGTSSFAAWGGQREMGALIKFGVSAVRSTKCTMQQHPEERSRSQTIRTTTLRCDLGDHWAALQMEREVYACVYNASTDECNEIPFMPVSLMPNFPHVPSLPVASNLTDDPAQHGVAICLQPLTGNVYDDVVRFFLWYYKQMGVSMVIAYDVYTSDAFHDVIKEASRAFGITWENHPWCPLTRSSSPACPPHLRILNKESWEWHANGQIAAQVDCVLRAAGRFRWVLFVDLDEYITVSSGPHLTLSQFIERQAANSSSWFRRRDVAPYAAVFTNQHFRICENVSAVSVPYLHENILPVSSLAGLPYPLTFQTALGRATTGRGKYMCDPLWIDEVMVHKPLSSLCRRYGSKMSGMFSCPSILYVDSSAARSIHVRAPDSTRGNWTEAKCSGGASMDYSLANRVVPLLPSDAFT